MIAQIGCYILMSSMKLILDIGLETTPGARKAVDGELGMSEHPPTSPLCFELLRESLHLTTDMITTTAQIASELYPEEDPEGAFNWWLSPCEGTDLVPEEIPFAYPYISS